MTSALREACLSDIDLGGGRTARMLSLPALEAQGAGRVSRLPVSLRVLLEGMLRHCGSGKVEEHHVRQLAGWQPAAAREAEIPFMVGRVVLNCTAGIPLLCDLAAMRDAAVARGSEASSVQPQVRVDMTLDHTLTVDYSGTPDALARNMQLEVSRNVERFSFVKWALQAFGGIRMVPPGVGILHQINLEYFAPGLLRHGDIVSPDTLVGTDSHTCMIAGLGTVGWGVGGIEAEAALLGQPVYFLTPDVVGVHVHGALRPGVTSTDLVLHVTNMLRRAKVVGQFVEFFGSGLQGLSVPDRATLANMAPEYGATIGFFPVDEQTCRYMRQTGRDPADVDALEAYYRAQGCFGQRLPGEIDYTRELSLDLSAIVPAVAGPKRPQDLIALDALKPAFASLLEKPVADGGYGVGRSKPVDTAGGDRALTHGDVVIAAITSCTNTSNPGVMLAAGLLARNAVRRGLRARPWVKTSLAPGSRVVSEYLKANDLQRDLDTLGFSVVGYSCSTCVGNSGPLLPGREAQIVDDDLVTCAVLSGNRNFEARIHPNVRAAFLASPPLVVAFALAGRVGVDFASEPLGIGDDGQPVYLRDVWPTAEQLAEAAAIAADPVHYRAVYPADPAAGSRSAYTGPANPDWAKVPQPSGAHYAWESDSTYIKRPPFMTDAALTTSSLRDVRAGRALAILGHSITTDHISPIGRIEKTSPAGRYLQDYGVAEPDFNNYGSRRMNHELMARGTFANIRLKNRMLPGVEGGMTLHVPSGAQMSIFDAAMAYAAESTPLFVFAGDEYGTGSARDWAAKGTRLLGVRAVVAQSFERIHRSNLVGLGVLPCQLPADRDLESLRLDGSETFDLIGLHDEIAPRATVTLRIGRRDGSVEEVQLTLRLDTPAEVGYVRRGGILPYVLDEIAA